MKKTWIIVVMAGLAGLSGLTCLVHPQPQREATRLSESEAEAPASAVVIDTQTLRSDLAQLRRDLSRVETSQLSAARDQAQAESANSTSAAQPTAETLVPTLTPEAALAAQTQLLEEHMQRDASDDTATDALYASLEHQPLPGALDTAVTCRRSLCRLDASFDSTMARDDGLLALGRTVPWDYDAFYRAAPDNARHMIVYLTREGATLPTLDMAQPN